MPDYSAINLPELPKPEAIKTLDYEQILSEMSAQLNGLQPLLFDGQLQPVTLTAELIIGENGESYYKVPVADDAGLLYLELESDPLPKLLEVCAYREMLLRQRINDGTAATMLAYATGADLEHEASRFNVQRQLITAAQPDAIPPVDAVYESDSSLRRRTQLALEGFSTAGPEGAYKYHALSASPRIKSAKISAPTFTRWELPPETASDLPDNAIVLLVDDDVGLNKPMPGDVAVTLLSTEGDGHADSELCKQVSDTLEHENIRPLTDRPRIRSAEIVDYQIEAQLTLYSGPDQTVVVATAKQALNNYIATSNQIGLAPTLSGFYHALKQQGVYDVNLIKPSAPIAVSAYQAANCTNINITASVIDG